MCAANEPWGNNALFELRMDAEDHRDDLVAEIRIESPCDPGRIFSSPHELRETVLRVPLFQAEATVHLLGVTA